MFKEVICFNVVILFSSVSFAQTVTVKKDNARIKGESIEGYTTELDGTFTDVNASFVKYLKSIAKIKQTVEFITITESTLNGKAYMLPIYALTKDREKTSLPWIGIKTNEWAREDVEIINKQLEKIVYDFGVQFYRDKVQLQIDESNRALQAVERQQQRFANQNRDLNIKLEDNKREKIQLEKSLEINGVDYTTLLQKIDKNKKDQDSLQIANDQIKKVIEMQKEKQRKIN